MEISLMAYIKIHFFPFLFMALLIVSYGCVKGKEEVISVNGSKTMGPFITSASELYEKSNKVKISITSAGSLKGFEYFIKGKCDIVDSSVKIPTATLWEAQKKGIIIKEFLIGYDILVPIAHPSNTVRNLFQGQLGDMYMGLIKDWNDAGGIKGKIVVVDRDEQSGTRLVMNERFFETTKVVEGSVKKSTDAGVIDYVSKHRDAVGYISNSMMTSRVKAITINGFSATKDNVEKGYYPLYRELYLYTNEKSYKGNIKIFIDLIMGKQGQKLIEKAGFIPVTTMLKPAK
jgi:phosphate transport system substrate-binding protein